ncbi:histidine phosphotransferase [Sphingomonas sp. Leaf24]|uniref:histidine phosphotransferase family protein n=1 Tax=unclassified Sphingomonas TaxID=196159 RepID=UPI0006F64DD1|nr:MULTISPECIES: histidine phosphotransferase family protein [unclassified Sphingomonas]KQM18062.1 histidine phosphotransferase [Sphingomonas sp. Leaf5]KQM89043.1 histidine phosphotransferase [Sphingomonas sp. Leaf24]
MNISPADFASLMCSRLCHDLLSPVGALNNGLELLADETDPDMRARCLELLTDSARASANKLKFFRLAFGAAGGFGDSIDTREARAALEGLFGDQHKVKLGWMIEAPSLPKPAVKVLLNLALIAGDALVRGGQLDVGAEVTATGIDIAVRGDGPRIVLDAELRGALLGDAAMMTPRAAAACLARELVEQGGGTLQVSPTDSPVLLFGASFAGR